MVVHARKIGSTNATPLAPKLPGWVFVEAMPNIIKTQLIIPNSNFFQPRVKVNLIMNNSKINKIGQIGLKEY